MKKYLLILPFVAVFVLSCSTDEEKEKNPYMIISPSSYLYFDARNPEPQEITVEINNIDQWDIYDISDQNYEHPDWIKAIKNGNVITVTVTENPDESNYRDAQIHLSANYDYGASYQSAFQTVHVRQNPFSYTQQEFAEIINNMIADKEVTISYPIGNGSSTSQTEVNKLRIEDGVFKYDGGSMKYTHYENGEMNEVTIVSDPFEIAVTFTKDSHETFYPYYLSEYIKLSGDDGKNLKISGIFYLSDYVWPHTGEIANFEAGSFSISASGGVSKSFSYYIWK